MDKIYEFVASNSNVFTWILVGLFVLAAIGIALAVIFIRKFALKRAYVKTLLKSIDTLDKKNGALEEQVKNLSVSLTEADTLSATLKSERVILNEEKTKLEKRLDEEVCKVHSLNAANSELETRLANSTSLDEYNKLVEQYNAKCDELQTALKKPGKVDTLITKVEELTKKAKPVIKKVVKKEVAKLKKYSLEDLANMYKHELMTMASDLKLTGWTRFSKDKLVNFIYENLPKEQKKKEDK